MSNPPPTVRAFLAGASGSGKSRGAWPHYLSRFPRRLLIDPMGEWERPTEWGYPGADAVVYSTGELEAALRKLASRGRWTIAIGIGQEEFAELVPFLIPLSGDEAMDANGGGITRSPIYRCGGAVLLNDEVDLVAPPRGLKVEVRTLYRRSRHAGLSLVSTTQRPEAVSREVSAQSHHVLCLHLIEPNARAYMQNLLGVDLAPLDRWCQTHPHGGLWKDVKTGTIRWLTERGELVQAQVSSLPLQGREEALREQAEQILEASPGDGGASSAAHSPAGLARARDQARMKPKR